MLSCSQLARALGLQLQILEVSTPDAVDAAFRATTRERADALIVRSGAFTNFHQRRIAELAIKNRLPAMYNNVDSGFLMSYDADRLESFRRAAIYDRQDPQRRQTSASYRSNSQ